MVTLVAAIAGVANYRIKDSLKEFVLDGGKAVLRV